MMYEMVRRERKKMVKGIQGVRTDVDRAQVGGKV